MVKAGVDSAEVTGNVSYTDVTCDKYCIVSLFWLTYLNLFYLVNNNNNDNANKRTEVR